MTKNLNLKIGRIYMYIQLMLRDLGGINKWQCKKYICVPSLVGKSRKGYKKGIFRREIDSSGV